MTYPHTRAADLDRSMTCASLDEAFADGQLDAGEHEERVSRAMAAKTLGELRTLLADLQPVRGVAPIEPAPQWNPSRRTLIAAGAAGLLIGAGLAGVAVGHPHFGSRSDGFGYSVAVGDPPNPIVAPVPQLLTVQGFETFLGDMRNTFRDTTITRMTVFDDHAIVTRADAGSGTGMGLYYFRGGFQAPTAVARAADDAEVDLATLNVPTVLALVSGAGQTLHVDNPTTLYFEVDGLDGGTVTIHAENGFAESGSLVVGIDGTVRQVNAASN